MKILAVLIEVMVQADQRGPADARMRGSCWGRVGKERETEGEDRRKDRRTDRRIDPNGKEERDRCPYGGPESLR